MDNAALLISFWQEPPTLKEEGKESCLQVIEEGEYRRVPASEESVALARERSWFGSFYTQKSL